MPPLGQDYFLGGFVISGKFWVKDNTEWGERSGRLGRGLEVERSSAGAEGLGALEGRLEREGGGKYLGFGRAQKGVVASFKSHRR